MFNIKSGIKTLKEFEDSLMKNGMVDSTELDQQYCHIESTTEENFKIWNECFKDIVSEFDLIQKYDEQGSIEDLLQSLQLIFSPVLNKM